MYNNIDISDLLKQFVEIKLRLDIAEKRIAEQDIVIEKSEKRIIELEYENKRLKRQLNQNSSNSSRPPSSDGFKKKPALPKKKKGKVGGQKGHKGKTLQQVENPDRTTLCQPKRCGCGHEFLPSELSLSEKRQIFDMPDPKLEVHEYQSYKGICPQCGLIHKGSFPEHVKAVVQYGDNVKAHVTLLNVYYKLPFKKIQRLFGDMFGYNINESTVYGFTKQCFDKLKQSEELIKNSISQQKVAHADETGIRVNGKLHWLHTATSLTHTYLFVHEKRGIKALDSDKSILGSFNNWLVHDCWSSYFGFKGMKHAVCGAHILRELEGLIESDESKWAKTFKTFLLRLYQTEHPHRVRHKNDIIDRYWRICNIADQLEPPPIKSPGKRGRYKRTKGRNLVERLIREQNAVLAFAFNEEVPFTNNLAERDVRPAKVKQKISNCFRTYKGAEIYARIQSFLSTAQKQNKDVFIELRNSFRDYNLCESRVKKLNE